MTTHPYPVAMQIMVAIAATFVFAWLVAPASVPLAVLLIAATWVLNLYIVSKRVRSLPKRSVAALVALSFTACLDSPGYQPEVAGEDEGDPTMLREVAYATAKALTASEVRLDVLAAMRASVRVEHALILGEYLGTPDGVRLLRGAAHAVGVTENEFHRRVLTLPALELVVPIRDHRLGWTGSAHIGVAGSLDSDATEFTIMKRPGYGGTQ